MAWEKSAVRYAKLDIMASSRHNYVIMPIVKQLEKIGYNGGMMAIIKQLGWVDDRSKMRHNIISPQAARFHTQLYHLPFVVYHLLPRAYSVRREVMFSQVSV